MGFEVMLNRLSPVLKRIAYKLNYGVAFFDTEDLFQEAVIHLWQKYNDNELGDKTDSFILQGCYFHLKNYLRKVKGRLVLVSLEDMMCEDGREINSAAFADNRHDSLNELESSIFLDGVSKEGLSAREQEVFSCLCDGLTVRQVAKRIGVSHVMVIKIKRTIRKKTEYLLDKR